MCQSIISVIVGKYIDRIVEAKNDKIELSIMCPISLSTARNTRRLSHARQSLAVAGQRCFRCLR